MARRSSCRCRSAGNDRLYLAEEGLSEPCGDLRIRSITIERGERHAAACVVDQDSGRPVLGASHLPCVLVVDVRVRAAVAYAPRPRRVPVARVELQLQLGVFAVAELRDRGLLE